MRLVESLVMPLEAHCEVEQAAAAAGRVGARSSMGGGSNVGDGAQGGLPGRGVASAVVCRGDGCGRSHGGRGLWSC